VASGKWAVSGRSPFLRQKVVDLFTLHGRVDSGVGEIRTSPQCVSRVPALARLLASWPTSLAGRVAGSRGHPGARRPDGGSVVVGAVAVIDHQDGEKRIAAVGSAKAATDPKIICRPGCGSRLKHSGKRKLYSVEPFAVGEDIGGDHRAISTAVTVDLPQAGRPSSRRGPPQHGTPNQIGVSCLPRPGPLTTRH
jgi:hypothetical protein